MVFMFDKSNWVELYESGKSCPEIARISGCSDALVQQHMNQSGAKMRYGAKRVFNFDEQFFDVIDTEEKAYWLGFIAADGGVHRTYVSIGLSGRDADHLKKLCDTIGYLGEVKIKQRKERPEGETIARLVLCSTYMVASLAKLGITPNKSLTLVPPKVCPDLERHFWRGMVDGDGCITWKPRSKGVSLVGSRATCEAFSDWVDRCAGGAGVIQTKQNIFSVFFMGTHRGGIVADKLYSGARVFLHRKMEKAKLVIEFHHRQASAYFEKAEYLRKWL